LWGVLFVLGTFLRGPNWNFFGPFASWDPHKVDPLNNVNVSEIFWGRMLGRPLEGMPILQREAPGLLLTAFYLLVLPPLLAKTIFPQVLRQDGLRALHHHDQPAAVHDVAAHQDGAALVVQPEVHRRHP